MYREEIILNVSPVTKKNHGRIITLRNGRSFVLPSEAYIKFEKECDELIENKYRKEIDFPINAKCIFYMKTKRKVDLTNLLNAAMDMLVATKVIKDDNSEIIKSHDGSRVMYDKDNPRVEITLEERSINV